MFLLVGSRAAVWLKRYNDWDFFATDKEVQEWFSNHKDDIVSFRFRQNPSRYLCRMRDGDRLSFDIDEGSARKFYEIGNKLYSNMTNSTHFRLTGAVPWDEEVIGFGAYKDIKFIFAPPILLMLIKKSHYNIVRNWEKTISDYHSIKRAVKREPTEEEHNAYLLRCKEVREWYGDSKANLDMSNDEFFANTKGIERCFVHDDLHLATCYYGRPLYERLKRDTDRAMIDRELFFKQSLEVRLQVVREECYAIALERFLIPKGLHEAALEAYKQQRDFWTEDNIVAVHSAYYQALKRICTTLTKGWFRDFACDHYPELKEAEVDYLGLFVQAIDAGKIKPKGEENATALAGD